MQAITADTVIAYITHDDRANILSASNLRIHAGSTRRKRDERLEGRKDCTLHDKAINGSRGKDPNTS